MRINLNDPAAFTLEAVRALIASKDDTKPRQLRVSEDGYLYLSDDVGNRNLEGVKFWLETLFAGNDYVGAKAAKDEKWVNSVYSIVRNAWQKGRKGYLDY
jgi:hypothetical protein